MGLASGISPAPGGNNIKSSTGEIIDVHKVILHPACRPCDVLFGDCVGVLMFRVAGSQPEPGAATLLITGEARLPQGRGSVYQRLWHLVGLGREWRGNLDVCCGFAYSLSQDRLTFSSLLNAGKGESTYSPSAGGFSADDFHDASRAAIESEQALVREVFKAFKRLAIDMENGSRGDSYFPLHLAALHEPEASGPAPKRQRLSFIAAPFPTRVAYEAYLRLPDSEQPAALSAALVASYFQSVRQSLLASEDGAFTAHLSMLSKDIQQAEFFNAATSLALTFGEVINLWQSSTAFSRLFSRVLSASPFDSFYYECPAVTAQSLAIKKYEHVTMRARITAVPSPADFQEHLDKCAEGDATASFLNLSGSSMLVAPTEQGDRSLYGQLSAFSRGATDGQKQAFWSDVSETFRRRLERFDGKPQWLNTEGAAVPWLHMRIDPKPKYYHHHQPYKSA